MRDSLLTIPSLLTIALAASIASAQIDCEIASAEDIGSDQLQTIASHASENLETLAGDDAEAAEEARRALFEPLRCRNVTGTFRRYYSNELSNANIAELIEGDDTRLVVVALELAGQCASSLLIDHVEGALTDDRPPVRVAAARAARNIFTTYVAGDGAIRDRHVTPLLETLDGALENETSTLVAERMIHALNEATGAESASVGRLAYRSLVENAVIQYRRILQNPPDGAAPRDAEAYFSLRTVLAIRAVVAGFANNFDLDRDLLRESALAAGLALAEIRARVARNGLPEDDSREYDLMRSILGSGETTLIATGNKLDSGVTPEEGEIQKALDAAILNANASRLTDAIDAWVGDGGVLFRAPFGFERADVPTP